jgi:hypothetical protein
LFLSDELGTRLGAISLMDQSVEMTAGGRKLAAERLREFVVRAVEAAPAYETPFYHLVLDRIFPDDVYAAMLANMPEAADYRPMHGRSKGHDLADGTHTRVKIDLFPEYIRHLPPEKRGLWNVVGRALCSGDVRDAFKRRLAPALERRFGAGHARTGMFPIPVLTRDIPGYLITPHTDTHWKGITVQLYLPRDRSISHIGTIFHKKLPDGSMPKDKQMSFAPNTGYAFAVGSDTWHSADRIGPEVSTRDSILLTYFVDAGVLRFLRNRGKRVGNFVLSEVRNRLP